MSGDIEGLRELKEGLEQLPERMQKSILRQWAKKWSAIAWAGAIQKAPVGKTRNLIAGIARRDSKTATLRKLHSLARSVVIGKKPAFHFHLVNLGTKPRWTGETRGKKDRKTGVRTTKLTGGKRAYRGVMPKNPFIAEAAIPMMGRAEQDLKQTIRTRVARLLKRRGG